MKKVVVYTAPGCAYCLFGEKSAKYCKLVGGLIMTVLGLVMLFAPHLLR